MRFAAIIVALLSFASGDPPSRGELDLAVARHIGAGRHSEALALIDLYLIEHPQDGQVLFEGARAACGASDTRRAATYAIRALRAGWCDDKAIDEDPALGSLRTHDSWDQVLAVRAQLRSDAARRRDGASNEQLAEHDATIALHSLREWMDRFPQSNYQTVRNEQLRITIASSIDRTGIDQTLTMVAALSQALRTSLFGAIQPDWILLVIATPTDAATYLRDPDHGGLYDHEARRLIARETGATLRHEYTHVLHYGDMQRRQQHHPIWLQEGLATLFEDWQLDADGSPVICSNLRSNQMLDCVRADETMPWIDFFSLDSATFMAAQSRHYAQARSILQFVTAHKKLGEWYRLYTTGYSTDSTGRRSLELIFDAPIGRIESMWKAWVLANGRRDTTIGDGDGVMGVGISGVSDGVRIDSLSPGGPAARARIAVGDVLVEVGGHEVRSVADFVLATATRRAGENLQVRFRRGAVYSIVGVTLASGHALPPEPTPPSPRSSRPAQVAP